MGIVIIHSGNPYYTASQTEVHNTVKTVHLKFPRLLLDVSSYLVDAEQVPPTAKPSCSDWLRTIILQSMTCCTTRGIDSTTRAEGSLFADFLHHIVT